MASGSSTAGAVSEDAKYRYDMSHKQRGICLIINNVEFISGKPTRSGSNKDAEYMKEVFELLGFQVITKTNQKANEMKILAEQLAGEDHTDADCVVMVLLSHGRDCDVIDGTDEELMLKHIYNPFIHSKTLAGKPKLFFIQACRGKSFDRGIELDGGGQSPPIMNPPQRIPQQADFMYAYSTPPDHYSFRNTGDGSWFMQAIREVFMAHGKSMEIQKLMTRVNYKLSYDQKYVSNTGDVKTHGKKQVSCYLSMLTKELYFTPKS